MIPRSPRQHFAADPLKAPVALATLVWPREIGVRAAHSVTSLLRLRRRLVEAVLLRSNVYLADYIDLPFFMGIFRPNIYLPSLSVQERAYIILHAQRHIRWRGHL